MTDGWLSLKIQLNLLSFLWKGPPIFRGFHCLWLLLDSFFLLPLTFLPHKILPPNLHLFYKNLQKLASKSCKFVKKNSVAAVVLLKTKRSIPICSPWVPFDLGSLYCLFRRTFAHFTKMCIKKQGKASAERRERERKVSFLACSADTNMRLLKFPIFRLVVTIKLGFLSERKHPTIYASVATSILRKRRAKARSKTFLFHLPFFVS